MATVYDSASLKHGFWTCSRGAERCVIGATGAGLRVQVMNSSHRVRRELRRAGAVAKPFSASVSVHGGAKALKGMGERDIVEFEAEPGALLMRVGKTKLSFPTGVVEEFAMPTLKHPLALECSSLSFAQAVDESDVLFIEYSRCEFKVTGRQVSEIPASARKGEFAVSTVCGRLLGPFVKSDARASAVVRVSMGGQKPMHFEYPLPGGALCFIVHSAT